MTNSVTRRNPLISDIRQGQPWLDLFAARRWFALSQPGQGHDSPARVRALTGRRMTKQVRHAGTHEGYESPHASDDARLDLPNHRQAVRLSSEGSDSRSIRTVHLRPQLNSGSRYRTERTLPTLRCWEPQPCGDRASESPRPISSWSRTDRRPVRLDPGLRPHRPALRS